MGVCCTKIDVNKNGKVLREVPSFDPKPIGGYKHLRHKKLTRYEAYLERKRKENNQQQISNQMKHLSAINKFARISPNSSLFYSKRDAFSTPNKTNIVLSKMVFEEDDFEIGIYLTPKNGEKSCKFEEDQMIWTNELNRSKSKGYGKSQYIKNSRRSRTKSSSIKMRNSVLISKPILSPRKKFKSCVPKYLHL